MAKLLLILGAINAAIVVGIGAFGAHGLEGRISERMIENYQTGVQYHMFHAAGILAVGFAALYMGGSALFAWAGGVMMFGIIFFAGSLYTMALTGQTWLGAVTPIGGVAFIAGWILFVIGVLKA
ncbi:uncharacterized membrane protein YgdD (TMEM256/DUF423 family) [Salsuginibacillus halophilus]|uniref:Uncharacterized membrane protein YgdD (TMEM256/DUF423 family) n=1 Tax=Salsuginibacillus halophilus TaxID=517424 RepID=A0A2P8HI54_9BACI|nr:DUF423 domain-containing protein [Salsuginibacillus halophilus]PSL45895.1 uncharacterized membrane protein YgdD (TMEM256/DUF423 family) [Salsuginibacillus halophilus]